MNANDKTDLERSCWINAVVIRCDGQASTFVVTSWLQFCQLVVQKADDYWGVEKGIAKVFGCEEGRDLEEHTVTECRRVAEAHPQPPADPTYPQFAPGTRVRDHFGNEHEVLEQVGCAVFMKDGERWHPTRVFAVQ